MKLSSHDDMTRVYPVEWEYFHNLEIDENNLSPLDFAKLNAFVCCCGIGVTADEYGDLSRFYEKRTGHTGLNIVFGNEQNLELKVVAPFVCVASPKIFPIYIQKQNDQWKLRTRGTILAEIELIEKPKWYKERTNGIPLFEMFQYEHGNLMGTIPNKRGWQLCDYSKNLRCKFCGLEQKRKNVQPEEIAETVEKAYGENDKIRVTLTSGNTKTSQRGIELYLPYVEAIENRVSGIQIEIEVSPPSDVTILESLKEAGLTSYNSNIEIYDDNLMAEVCPGKATIPKDDYWDAFRYAKSKNLATYGAILVGLEPPSSTLKGIEHLAKLGVMANPLPFVPIRGSTWETMHPIDPKYLLIVSWYGVNLMRQYKVNPTSRTKGGCGLCGGCSLEVNLDRNYEIISGHLKEYTEIVELKWKKWW